MKSQEKEEEWILFQIKEGAELLLLSYEGPILFRKSWIEIYKEDDELVISWNEPGPNFVGKSVFKKSPLLYSATEKIEYRFNIRNSKVLSVVVETIFYDDCYDDSGISTGFKKDPNKKGERKLISATMAFNLKKGKVSHPQELLRLIKKYLRRKGKHLPSDYGISRAVPTLTLAGPASISKSRVK